MHFVLIVGCGVVLCLSCTRYVVFVLSLSSIRCVVCLMCLSHVCLVFAILSDTQTSVNLNRRCRCRGAHRQKNHEELDPGRHPHVQLP